MKVHQFWRGWDGWDWSLVVSLGWWILVLIRGQKVDPFGENVKIYSKIQKLHVKNVA